jgi:hypothetical protein
MKMLTITEGDDTYQVQTNWHDTHVARIRILTKDQTKELYAEIIRFPSDKTAQGYIDEFSKTDAKKIVKRYLRYQS